MKYTVALILVCALVITSCMQGGESSDSVRAVFEFKDSSGVTGSSVSSAGSGGAPAGSVSTLSTANSPTFDVINDLYAELGDLVGSYTPSEFRLNIWAIYLYQVDTPGTMTLLTPYRDHGTEAQSELSQANFVDDVVLDPFHDVEPGFYDGLGIELGYGPRAWVNDGIVRDTYMRWLEETVITVEVPGYEDVWTGLSETIDLTDDGFGSFESFVKNADGSLTIGLDQLQPGRVNFNYESTIASNSFDNITNIFFTGMEYYAVVVGEEGHPDYFDSTALGLYNSLDPPGPVFSGNGWGGVIIPFSGTTVPDGVEQIVFRVSLDLEGIIEVYDAGTPGTKSDDVMVLANNFWQRFDVTAWTR